MTKSSRVKTYSPKAWWNKKSASQASKRIVTTSGFTHAMIEDGISLAFTSRQSNLLATISISEGECCISTLMVPSPMGLALRGSSLAVGTSFAIRVYHQLESESSDEAAFMPVAMNVTGAVSVHDVAWGNNGKLWFVNTLFSAICSTDVDTNFKIEWQPDFVSEIGPLDCCHLNGMAILDGLPRFITALSQSGRREGWRELVPDSGVLMDLDQRILCEGLSLPHSPKIHDGNVWLLESGKGNVLSVSPTTSEKSVICQIPGVLRGLDCSKRYAFVGLSKIRHSSELVTEKLFTRYGDSSSCRIYAIDLRSGKIVGHAELGLVDEISSLAVVPVKHMSILEPSNVQTASTYVYKY